MPSRAMGSLFQAVALKRASFLSTMGNIALRFSFFTSTKFIKTFVSCWVRKPKNAETKTDQQRETMFSKDFENKSINKYILRKNNFKVACGGKIPIRDRVRKHGQNNFILS